MNFIDDKQTWTHWTGKNMPHTLRKGQSPYIMYMHVQYFPAAVLINVPLLEGKIEINAKNTIVHV